MLGAAAIVRATTGALGGASTSLITDSGIVVNPSGQGADTDSTYSLGVPAIVVLGSQGISTSTR